MVPCRLPQKVRPLLLFLLIVPFWTNSLIRIYGLKIFLSTKGYLNEFLLWLGVIDTPIRIMFTPSAVIIGLVYILLPFMVMPLYSSIEKLDRRCWKRRKISAPASCRRLSASSFR